MRSIQWTFGMVLGFSWSFDADSFLISGFSLKFPLLLRILHEPSSITWTTRSTLSSPWTYDSNKIDIKLKIFIHPSQIQVKSGFLDLHPVRNHIAIFWDLFLSEFDKNDVKKPLSDSG